MTINRVLAVLFLLTGMSLAQGVRFGDSLPTQSTASVPGVSNTVIVAIPNATISFCTSPANAVPCTNKAATFSDSSLTLQCPGSTQVVLAGTANCVATSDARGNWGVWVTPGSYDYTVTANGVSSGPFPATPGSGGTGGVNCPIGTVAIPYFSGTTTLCDPNLTDDGAGTLGVSTLNASTGINTPQITFNSGAGFLIGPFQKQTAPANPPSTQIVCWGDSGTNLFACKNSDGSNAMPSGGVGSLTTQVNGVNLTSQSTLNFSNPSSFNGLTFTYSNPSAGNMTFALGGTLNNAGLTNPSTTVNGQACTLGSTCTISGSSPTVVNGSSDTLTGAGTFATQTSVTAGSTSFFEIRAHGVLTTTATANPIENIQVNAFGTTGLCTRTQANSITINTTNVPWDLVCYVHILTTGNPGTATIWGSETAAISGFSGTFASHIFNPGAVTQSAITTTSQTISIQEIGTLVSGTSITLQSLIVRPY